MKYENNYGVRTQDELGATNKSHTFNSSPEVSDLEMFSTSPTSKNRTNSFRNTADDLSYYDYTGNNKVYSNQTDKKKAMFTSLDSLPENDDIIRTLWSNGIYRKNDFDDFNKFYIFPRKDPYKMVGTTREYMFITKPDLHIYGSPHINEYDMKKSFAENSGLRAIKEITASGKQEDTSQLNPELKGILFFNDLFVRGYKDVLASLCYSHDESAPFVNILSNYKTSNVELSNITVGDEETATNIYNTRIFYRKPSDTADEESEITLEFKDNKYLDCYLWFKAYDMYERLKYQGKVTPIDWNYTMFKVLSDQMSIFRFVVADDGETIIHWSQMWGCYPKSVPRAVLSDMPEDGMLRFSVDWKVTFQADMDPLTIMHFNALCELYRYKHKVKRINLFDEISQRITGEAANIPHIEESASTGSPRRMYLLKWYKEVV